MIRKTLLIMVVILLSMSNFHHASPNIDMTEGFISNSERKVDKVDSTVFQKEGVRAFGFLYIDYLDEREVEQTKDETKKTFFKNYGGSYLDDEYHLSVYYKREGETVAKKVQKIIEKKAGCSVDFLPVNYSLQDLRAFKEELYELINVWETNGKESWVDAIQGVGISQKNNCLRVKLGILNEDEQNELQQALAQIPCEFEVTGVITTQPASTIHPGNEISNGVGLASTGFRCQYNGGVGFITTLHSNTVGTYVTNSSGNTVGQVLVSYVSSYVDFSFVRMHEIYGNTFSQNPLGNTNYTLSSNYVSTELSENYPVLFAGKKKSYIRYGTVVDWDYSMTSGILSHWLICDYEMYHGDSGGCVFTLLNGTYWIIGINDGFINMDNQTLNYCTKFSIMKNYCSSLVLY